MCLPGTFILMNEGGVKFADKLLKDGWIELDENGGKDFHVTSIFAEELAAANAS